MRCWSVILKRRKCRGGAIVMSRGGPGASVYHPSHADRQHLLAHFRNCFRSQLLLFSGLPFYSLNGFLFWTAAAKSLQSCPTLCDAVDGSPPASSNPGVLQARILEWVAMSFFFEQKPPILTVQLTCPRLRISSFCVLDKSPTSWGHSLRVETLRETQAIIRNYSLVALLFIFRFMIL